MCFLSFSRHSVDVLFIVKYITLIRTSFVCILALIYSLMPLIHIFNNFTVPPFLLYVVPILQRHPPRQF